MEVRRSLQRELVETATAQESVLYANTASFLFDRLRRDSSAGYIAHELAAQEIIELLREKSANPQGPMDLVWVYVLLAALSLKNIRDLSRVRTDLDATDLSRVQWGEQLRASILDKGPRTNVVEINYRENKNENPRASANVVTGQVVNAGRSR